MEGLRVIRDLADPRFQSLFTSLRRAWFRLETLQHYDVGYEREEFTAFLRGEPFAAEAGPWEEMIRAHVAAGRRLGRVHVIEEPHSDYIRYELAGYGTTVAAGEDVRVIPVARGDWPSGVPKHDYWLFDDRDLWLMAYDATGAFVATERVDDPDEIERHRRWRDAAIAQSVPLADYSAPPAS